MTTPIIIWLAALGLCVGSFINVLVYRLPRGENIARPPSRCPSCGHRLRWFENVPLISYLVLRAKCRACKAPISARYPTLEVLTAVLFVAAYSRFGWGWELAGALVFIGFVLPLIFIDAEFWILPFELTLPAIACAVAFKAPLGTQAVMDAVLGAGVGFAAFRAVEFLAWVVTGRAGLGGGDKYLLALCGAQLGARALLGVVILSSAQGAVFGLIQYARTGRAGPPPSSGKVAAAPSGREPFTPAFLKPGLAWWQRLAMLPYTVLVQEIPDPLPLDADGDEPTWVPGATNLPYGPWIGLAAFEVMLLAPYLYNVISTRLGSQWGALLFGL